MSVAVWVWKWIWWWDCEHKKCASSNDLIAMSLALHWLFNCYYISTCLSLVILQFNRSYTINNVFTYYAYSVNEICARSVCVYLYVYVYVLLLVYIYNINVSVFISDYHLISHNFAFPSSDFMNILLCCSNWFMISIQYFWHLNLPGEWLLWVQNIRGQRTLVHNFVCFSIFISLSFSLTFRIAKFVIAFVSVVPMLCDRIFNIKLI